MKENPFRSSRNDRVGHHCLRAVGSSSGMRQNYQEHGPEKIRDMIVDDIRASQARNDQEQF